MKTKILIVITLIIYCSCSSREQKFEVSSLEGAWFYIDPSDSSYNELYFSNELFIYNLEAGFLGPIFHYHLTNDSIFIDGDKSFLYKRFLFKIRNEAGMILLQDEGGNEFELNPLPNVFDWGGLILTSKYSDRLREGWFQRNEKYGKPDN